MGMKKIYVFGLLLAVCLASCSVNDVKPDVAEPELGSRLVTLYANAGEMTKTDYAGDVTFSWVAGDKISVLYHNSLDEPVWVELTANQGEPAAKLAVTKNFKICTERQNINTVYTRFSDWVGNTDIEWY